MPATSTLDLLMYPHILDSILGFSSLETLIQLSRTCTTVREKIFDYHIPVRHVQLSQGCVFCGTSVCGIGKDNISVSLTDKALRTFHSTIQVVDVIGEIPDSVVPRGVPVIRYVPYEMYPIIFVTETRPGAASPPLTERIVTVPFSFPSLATPMDVHMNLSPPLTSVSRHLAKSNEPATILMIENRGFTNHTEVQHLCYEYLVGALVMWLRECSEPVKLVFVNISAWLKLLHPYMTAEQRLTRFLDDLSKGLRNEDRFSSTSWSRLAPVLEGASFKTLDEYKAEVGEVAFDLQTHLNIRPPSPRSLLLSHDK